MTSYPDADGLRVRRDGVILRLTLDRPGARNSVTHPMVDALIACLDDPDNGTMEAAATALAAFGLLARRALPALERLRFQFRADHPDSSPRRGIDVAIAGIAVDARPGGHDPTPPTAPAQP
jgi:hypothetical protein